MVRIMRDLRKKYPDADMAEIAKMASHEVLNNQQKSRAFYRIQATRLMTGAGNIMNKSSKQDVINSVSRARAREYLRTRSGPRFCLIPLPPLICRRALLPLSLARPLCTRRAVI